MASIYGAVSATGWPLRLDYTVSQDAAYNRSALALTLYIYDGTGVVQPGGQQLPVCFAGENRVSAVSV